jgi:hypothetical protein
MTTHEVPTDLKKDSMISARIINTLPNVKGSGNGLKLLRTQASLSLKPVLKHTGTGQQVF